VILRETYQVDSMENYAMAAKPSIDPARFLYDQLASASPDQLRSLVTTFVDALMSAEADAACGAPCGPRMAGNLSGGRAFLVILA
jgi:putative transposase